MHLELGNGPEQVRDGVKWGLIAGLGFAAIAAGLFILRLGAALNHSPTLLARVILLYLVAGPLAGIVVSLLRPLARWAVGAGIIGACAAIPAYAGMMIAVDGPGSIRSDGAWGFIVLGAAIGATAGVIVRYRLIKRGLFKPG